MDDLLKLISIKLKTLRIENKMSLEDVSKKIGLHRETIRRYENNSACISIDNLLLLLNIYHIDASIFFEQLYGKLPYNINGNNNL